VAAGDECSARYKDGKWCVWLVAVAERCFPNLTASRVDLILMLQVPGPDNERSRRIRLTRLHCHLQGIHRATDTHGQPSPTLGQL
jgi:hypothetical protein